MTIGHLRDFATLTCFLAACLCISTAHANPTGKDPYRPLAAHGTISEAKAMVDGLYKLYQEEEKFVIDTYAKIDNPASWSDRQISKAAGRLWKARRDTEHLKLMGEPAADDLYKKLFMLAVEVDKFGMAYRGTPRGSQLVQRYTQQLNREKPGFTKFLQAADRAVDQGKLEAVETQLDAKGVQLYEKLVYYSPSARKPYNTHFYQVLGKNDNLLEKQRKDEYMKRASEAMQKEIAAATGLPAEVDRIRGEIAASGTAKLAGEKTGGPAEAFAHVASLWGNASAGLIRATAIQWAFTNRASAEVQPSPQQLKEIAIRSLASIIEAAAASTPPDQVSSVYADLLKQISAVERRIGPYSKEVKTGCESALSKLAAKDPKFAPQIAAYERATSEPLRWRKLYASQQAKTLGQKFPAVIQSLDSKAPPTDGIRPSFVRLAGEKITAPNSFGEPASWMVQEAATRLVGTPILQDEMIRLTPTSRTAVVPFSGRHYGNVPVPMPSEKEFGDLKTALVVDDTHGPLTVEAADAISASELQDYLSVAGLVQTVHLESAVTRFIGLPNVAYTLSPLGSAPRMAENMSPLQQTCWRLDVQPVWAQHRYFTVMVPSKTP